MSTDWMTSAPCASADPESWFPEDGGYGLDAKKICATCPYKAPCLLGALERGETAGIWGGVNAHQFRQLQIELGLKQPRMMAAPGDPRCPSGHEPEQIRIKPDGKRQCRECNREHRRTYRAKKRGDLSLASAPTMRRALEQTFGDEGAVA